MSSQESSAALAKLLKYLSDLGADSRVLVSMENHGII
jgi:hypothetical protein